MKIKLLLLAALLSYSSYSQVKMGDNPTIIGASSLLELESTNKALVITRVADMSSITTPVNGMIVYDIFNKCIRAYENGAWSICLNGSAVVDASSNGTAVVSSYFCSTASEGTLASGFNVSQGGIVTQTITANVATEGTYNIATTANGVTFTASGIFNIGNKQITLTAIGTPTTQGTFSYAKTQHHLAHLLEI
jgi:hypothetical protein